MAIRTSLMVVTAISFVFSRNGIIRAADCRAVSKPFPACLVGEGGADALGGGLAGGL